MRKKRPSPARRLGRVTNVRSVGDLAAAVARPVRTGRPSPRSAEVVTPRSAVVVLGGAVVRQTDPTTCGSTALLMLAATGDPALARWLEDGTLPEELPIDELPPEVPPSALARDLSAAGRIAAAQHRIKERTNAAGVGPLPWPDRFGTPPWTAAREARFPGVRYVHRPVDDRGEAGRAMVTTVLNALSQGFPVLLFTGGNRGQGLVRALPRHVVLAVPSPARRVTAAGDEVISIFEPSEGMVHEVPAGELVDRTTPHRALGNWTHVQWVAFPTPDPSNEKRNP
ncbi:MAG: hypothetical protein ACQERF_02665 [Actinomycetota bacterium]